MKERKRRKVKGIKDRMTILIENIPMTIMEDKEYFLLTVDGVDKGLGISKTSENGEVLVSIMQKLLDLQELRVHQNQTGTKARGIHEAFMRAQEGMIKEGLITRLEE